MWRFVSSGVAFFVPAGNLKKNDYVVIIRTLRNNPIRGAKPLARLLFRGGET